MLCSGWRSETPLIYKAVPSWFVSVEKIKERLLAANAQTYWVPEFVKEKRFHNWSQQHTHTHTHTSATEEARIARRQQVLSSHAKSGTKRREKARREM